MRTEFLCISVLREASGPRVKLASRKSALNPCPSPHPTPVVYSTDRSKAVVTGVSLTLCCFCGSFYEAICFMPYLVSFCSCVFQSF